MTRENLHKTVQYTRVSKEYYNIKIYFTVTADTVWCECNKIIPSTILTQKIALEKNI